MGSLAPGPGQIKGLAFREFLRWYIERHNPAKLIMAIARLPASQRELFDLGAPALGVLSSRWYEARVVHAVLEAAAGARTDGVLEMMAREAALDIMATMMNGVYQFAFSSIVSPARWISLRQTIWDLYYDTGTLHSELTSERSVRTWYGGWLGHHRLACMLTRASNLAIYRAMGLDNVEVKLTRCVDRGDTCCEVLITWE